MPPVPLTPDDEPANVARKRALQSALRHVRWIGGPPDAGKSTVADALARHFDLPVYHFDRYEREHIARAIPTRHPRLYALQTQLATLDEHVWLEEGWVRRPVAEMVTDAIACWSERIELAVEDLLNMPQDRTILAEGPGFFPPMIAPLLSTPQQAIFLAATEAFKRASHARRGKSAARHRTSDPERYLRNHIERDLLIADYYIQTARETGLALIMVDGAQSVEQLAAEVAAHLGL